MKITAKTELMKNQKHAEVMAPDSVFDVLQTTDGDALFFSIGTDHVFYVTKEVRTSQTGWLRLDLSSKLSEPNGGAEVRAKSFALSQDPKSLHFDLALVVTIDGSDVLYLSAGRAADAEDWVKTVSWTSVPFDAVGVTAPQPLTIADVYLMNIPFDDGSQLPTQNLFVDILQTPGHALKLLDRYFINLNTPTRWSRHALAADLKEGSISSCLGRRTDDFVPGIYTFGLIENTRELIFRPQYNHFRPEVAPNSARLGLPPGANAIASAINECGETNLFVASPRGLYVFSPDNQFDKAEPVLAVPTAVVGKVNLFDGVSSLTAETQQGRTVVWILNAHGDMFYVTCPAGSETKQSAWNNPVPFCNNVEHFAFYLNRSQASSNVLFAHLGGNELLQFTQDAATSLWTQRAIMLPTTDIDKYTEFTSFTSQVCITDDSDVCMPEIEALLTTPTPVSVYVNNTYHMLTPDVPICVKTDVVGMLNIVQETTSLVGAKVRVEVEGNTLDIDPMSKIMKKMGTITQGSDLSSIMITNSDGSKRPLVPKDIPEDVRSSAAKQIAQLVQLKGSVPDAVSSPFNSANQLATTVMANAQPVLSGTTNISFINSAVNSFNIASGDMFAWLNNACDSPIDWMIHTAGDVWLFIVKIGPTIYNTILDSVGAVVDAIGSLFNRIKVSFEDLFDWLAALFNWKDIKRTHMVMKHVMKRSVERAIDKLDDAKDFVDRAFIDLEDIINSWADITDPGESIGTQQSKPNNHTTESSPQSNWAIQHIKNGANSAEMTAKEPSATEAALRTVKDIIDQLAEMMKEEGQHVETVITQLHEQVVEQYSSLTAVQVIRRVVGILGGLMVKTARNVLGKIIQIVKMLIRGVFGMLDGALKIPILSKFYKHVTGNELTVLDLVVWVGAIPATLGYKLLKGVAPYPDDASVVAIVNASRPAQLSSSVRTAPVAKNTPVSMMAAMESRTVSLAASSAKRKPSGLDEALIKKQGADIQNEMKTWGNLDTLQMCFDIAATVGSILYCLMYSIRWVSKQAKRLFVPPAFMRWCFAASYLLYVAPNFVVWKNAGAWYTVLNDIITGISVLKVLAECTQVGYASPVWGSPGGEFLEMCISIVWLVPTIAAIREAEGKASDWTMFAGKLCFILRGIIAPATLLKTSVSPGAIIAQIILGFSYGILCSVSAGLMANDL